MSTASEPGQYFFEIDYNKVAGRKFVWLYMPPWDELWTRQNHFALRLGKLGANVLYVNKPNTLSHSLRDGNWRASFVPSRTTRVAEGVDVLSLPPILPGSARNDLLGKLVARQIAGHVNRWLKLYGWDNYILWNRMPINALVVSQLSPRAAKVVYDITDDYVEFMPALRAITSQRERKLLKLSDLVLVTSETLLEKQKPLHSNIHLLPNGVDFEIFSQVGTGTLEIHPALDEIKRPIIGYVGAIAEWVDLDLIEAIGERWPGQFVLVGPVSPKLRPKAASIKSVVWFSPETDRQKLVTYLEGMAVCTIPFKVNEITRNANPLKIWEYLATGIPIVATDLPALAPCREVINIARSHSEFLDHLQSVLESRPSVENVVSRRAIASDFSWDTLFSRMMKHLYPLL